VNAAFAGIPQKVSIQCTLVASSEKLLKPSRNSTKNYPMGIERRSSEPIHTDKRRKGTNEKENTETARTNPFYAEEVRHHSKGR